MRIAARIAAWYTRRMDHNDTAPPPPPPPPPRVAQAALYAAIAAAQAAATAIGKDASNQHHRYDYTSAEAIMIHATACLAAHGLAVICVGWSLADAPPGDAAGIVTARYLVTHADGGALPLIDVSEYVIPGKGRPIDKALAAALTYIQGYALRGILNIPRIDGGAEVDARDDRAAPAPWIWPMLLKTTAAKYFAETGAPDRQEWRGVFSRALGRPWSDLEGATGAEVSTLIAWLDSDRERLANDEIKF